MSAADVFNEPSLDALIRAMSGELPDTGGWADLDPKTIGASLAKMRHEQRQKMKAEANTFRDCFLDNPAGRKVLEIFLDMTLRAEEPPLGAFANRDMMDATHLYDRAQREFVRAIMAAIAMAENADLDDEE